MKRIAAILCNILAAALLFLGIGCGGKTYTFQEITGYQTGEVVSAQCNYSKQESAVFEFDAKYLSYIDVEYRVADKQSFGEEDYSLCLFLNFEEGQVKVYIYDKHVYVNDANGKVYVSKKSVSCLIFSGCLEGL